MMNKLILAVFAIVCISAVQSQGLGAFGNDGAAANTAIAANEGNLNQQQAELSAEERRALVGLL